LKMQKMFAMAGLSALASATTTLDTNTEHPRDLL